MDPVYSEAVTIDTTSASGSWSLEALYRKVAAEAEDELTGLPFQVVLDRIANRVHDALPATLGASVILWDADEGRFTVASTTVPGQSNDLPARRVRTTGGATRWVIDFQDRVVVPDTANDPFGANPMIGEFKVKAYAAVPIMVQGESVGVLYALETAPKDYSEAELLFLERLARRAAIEISTARQLGRAASIEGRHDALMSLTRALIEADSADETLQAIVDAVAASLPADRVLVVTIDEATRTVHEHIAGGPGAEMIVPGDYDDLMAGLTGWALRTHQTIISPKGHPDTREGPSARKLRLDTGGGSIVVVPLRFAGMSLGTMTVVNRMDQDDFDEDAVRLAEAMANQAATAIAQTQLAASIHDHDANLDPVRVGAGFVEAMNERDGASLVALLAETAILSIPGRSLLAGEHMGRRAFLRALKVIAESTDDSYNARIVDTYVSNRGVILLVETSGERDGRSLDGQISLRLTLINGRIVRVSAVSEDLYKFDEDWAVT